MAKVFISFLGIGDPRKNPGYDEITYKFPNNTNIKSYFVQKAILEKEGKNAYDKIYILMTPESKKKHWQLLKDEILQLGYSEDVLFIYDNITINQNTAEQWGWFEVLLHCIQTSDTVIFDFTHGFRSVPIIFSTAISFLQKVKKFKLQHAYYGYISGAIGEIIDMANFYRINEWADGLNHLIDSADASLLAELAEEENKDTSFSTLNDTMLIGALKELTELIKNIDVNHVAEKAETALKLIKEKLAKCSGADKQLLEIVFEKFSSLGISNMKLNWYTENYFQVQFILIQMLLKHKLFMQAFTVMRGIASFGMVNLQEEYRKYSITSKNGRRYRKYFGEIFFSMCANPRKGWHYEDMEKIPTLEPFIMEYFQILLTFWNELESLKIADSLHNTAKNISTIRNGFDHAWVSGNKDLTDIEKKGNEYFNSLKTIYESIKNIKPIASLNPKNADEKSFLILMSHKLTPEQITDAQSSWGVQTFVYLPENLQEEFSQITPDPQQSKRVAENIIQWLDQNSLPGDIVCIQGEYGVTFAIVTWCKNNQRVPVYGATERQVIEKRCDDGSVHTERVFKHCAFVEYYDSGEKGV